MSDSLNARQLIQNAFDRARQSGKADWWCMAIPVLKNRLLQMTDRDFRESAYGAHSFREFIQLHEDMLRVEESPFPGFVVLRSAEPESAGTKFQTMPRTTHGPVSSRVGANAWNARMSVTRAVCRSMYSGDKERIWLQRRRVGSSMIGMAPRPTERTTHKRTGG